MTVLLLDGPVQQQVFLFLLGQLGVAYNVVSCSSRQALLAWAMEDIVEFMEGLKKLALMVIGEGLVDVKVEG